MSRLREFLRPLKGYLITFGGAVLFWILFILFRENRSFANFIIDHITTPWKQGVGFVVSKLPFSVMELSIAALIILGIVLIIRCIRQFKEKGGMLICRTAAFVICAAMIIYDGFCLFWGINYYGDSFQDKSGVRAREISVEELLVTTVYYARMADEYCTQVKRDENGSFAESLDDIFASAEHSYDNISGRWEFLDTPWRAPKRVFFSKIMSYTNFTGVFFPFASESNLNVDCTPSLIPATITHELAHQKNVAPEQEANFVGIQAAVTSDDPVYRYSGALTAYIYLGNALYSADRDLWAAVRNALHPLVVQDLEENSLYWDQFETKVGKAVADASEAVYTGFLQSYGQTMGMKSYGACVDLLVADYVEQMPREQEGTE